MKIYVSVDNPILGIENFKINKPYFAYFWKTTSEKFIVLNNIKFYSSSENNGEKYFISNLSLSEVENIKEFIDQEFFEMSLANFKKEYLDFFNCFEKIIK
jgi:hypothetical protein